MVRKTLREKFGMLDCLENCAYKLSQFVYENELPTELVKMFIYCIGDMRYLSEKIKSLDVEKIVDKQK